METLQAAMAEVTTFLATIKSPHS